VVGRELQSAQEQRLTLCEAVGNLPVLVLGDWNDTAACQLCHGIWKGLTPEKCTAIVQHKTLLMLSKLGPVLWYLAKWCRELKKCKEMAGGRRAKPASLVLEDQELAVSLPDLSSTHLRTMEFDLSLYYSLCSVAQQALLRRPSRPMQWTEALREFTPSPNVEWKM